MDKQKPKTAHRIHNGKQVPEMAVIHTNDAGMEFYISGATRTGTTTIKYIDTGEYQEIATSRVQKYIDQQNNALQEYFKKPEHRSKEFKKIY